MFNPINAAKNIKDTYVDYISTSFHISDQNYSKQFYTELQKTGNISKGPYLDITDSFKTGKSLHELIDEGEASSLFLMLEGNIPDKEKEIQINRSLYKHQEAALRKTNKGRNLIVTTGTGSGKTECFIIPIVNGLLDEIKNGTLTSGVRAILIYPMNALANDQMKRLRNLLKNFPEITFGVYNSSTKQHHEDAVVEYGKVYKDVNGLPLRPLENEIISRDEMQQTPPHILVTNYAMLEYMMLRPKDDKVFSGAKLRYLVLDEAHIYRGTTGMETSLLLKRLKARISDPGKVQHILTSATLGGEEANHDIVKFGNTLCNASFYPEDIIRSEVIIPAYDTEPIDVPLQLFKALANPQKPLNVIVEEFGFTIDEEKTDEEFLYDLCLSASIYRAIRKITDHPMTVSEITDVLSQNFAVSEADIVNVITVASQASKNKMPLIKARFHMFAKALEGAYITLGMYKKLMLTRNSSILINGEPYKVFECAVCDECGRIAVFGKDRNGTLEFANNRYDEDADFYFIKDVRDKDLYIEEDEENFDTASDIGKNDFLLCSKCGAIIHESLKEEFPCSCGSEYIVKVQKTERKGHRKDGKCPSCSFGHFRQLYLGYDAATAVLGTALFEELPESETVLKSKKQTTNQPKGLFGGNRQNNQAEIIKRKRQFLSFSDSRGEAAFFATYMSGSYKEFLRRRGIWHIVEANKKNMAEHPWEIKHFVDELVAYFDSCRTFSEPDFDDSYNLSSVSRKQAWIAVLNEMVNARRSTSLSSLGVIKFNYKGNNEDNMSGVADMYGLSVQDTKALFDIMVMDIVNHGAIEGECNLTDDEREYIYYSPRPKHVKRCKDSMLDKNKAYILGWSSGIRQNGNLIKNGRLKRTMRALNLDESDANELLQTYWDEVLLAVESLSAAGGEAYYFKTDKFTISAGTDAIPIYQCDVCGKTTMHNCLGMCTTLKCQGHLHEVSHQSLIENNHYANLYQSSLMQPLHIKEHTAQLGREEQQKYQEMFVNKEINALSCSTTFEMGVDVGDLETVYLRNMPPSPSNYVQRAGRAGRGKNAAAFSLTYSKLSSHDFTYYNDPTSMISGKIGVPLFAVRNEKVVLRHIFAVALSDFFAKNEDVYNGNNADVLLNRDGWERLCLFLNQKPQSLKLILKESIPEDMHRIMGIDDYSWTEKLIGEEGILKIAVEGFRTTVSYYENEIQRLLSAGDHQQAANFEQKLWRYRRANDDNRGRNELIEFLVRNNVLPKYGFPVDTVELYQNFNSQSNKKLQMVRDLQLAISEYAPDAQVVADGKLYTSRYIRKLPQSTGQDWENVYIAQCSNSACNTWNYRSVEPDGESEKCISCHETIEKSKWKSAIEPRRGFVADARPKDVPLKKPERSYRSDDFYIGDSLREIINKTSFEMENGNRFQMETSLNDSLMVVCNDDFYVCPYCGYAESTSENMEKPGFNSYKKTLERKHTTPWGKTCKVILEKNKLCHVFKTDVVRLVFMTTQAKDYEVMLSVMYALLEALSSALDIDRNDIKGCLHKVSFRHKMIYTIILYDAVAGGAGHVRRLVTNDGKVFQEVVQRAIDITKNCKCSPSCYNCLRNYYNQKIHDKLNRESAYRFLENYAGHLSPISDDEFEKTEIDLVM